MRTTKTEARAWLVIAVQCYFASAVLASVGVLLMTGIPEAIVCFASLLGLFAVVTALAAAVQMGDW